MSDRPDSNPIQQTAASHLHADGDINIGSITQIVNQGDALRGIPSDFCWQEVCQSMLATTKALTSNLFTTRAGTTFELDDIYVPLGLVEKQPLQKRHENVSPELGSQLYRETQEKITPIAHNQFFEQVLERGVSPKSQGRRIALTGEAGAGKTTLLQKIAHWVLENDLGLPIWVRLGQVRDSTVSEYLTGDWLSTAKANVTPKIKEDLEKQCREGRVWLLLDGLDEMSNPTEARFIASLQSGWVMGARMVLTCRLNVWEIAQNSLSGFDVYRNLDFEPEQMEEFIRRWFAKTGETQAGERLLQALNNPGKERIKDLVKNPLRCSLLCRSWQLGEGELPDTKAEIYAQFVDAIYDEWKDWTPEPFPTRSAAKRELNKALGRLAIRAFDEEKSRFVLSHRLVSSELGEPDEPLFRLALKLNWLNPVGIDPKKTLKNVYAFYHPTFEEYFAACAIDDWHFFLKHVSDNPNHPEASYRIFESQWKEPILLWLGREDVAKEQKEEFIETLVEFEDGCGDFYWYRAYFLAAVGIGEFGESCRAGKIEAQIVQWSIGHFNPKKQELQVFLYPLKTETRAILQGSTPKRAIEELIERLHNITDRHNRGVFGITIRYLEDIGQGNTNAITALQNLLYSSDDQEIRWRVAHSFIKISPSNPKAISTLIELTHPTVDEDIRWLAASSLMKIEPNNPEAISTLIELTHSTIDEDIRWRVATCLGEVDPNHVRVNEVTVALVKLIRTTYSNENTKLEAYKNIRLRAACSLARIDPNHPEASAGLIELIRTSPDEETRIWAADRLKQINPDQPEAIMALLDLTHTTVNEKNRLQSLLCLDQDNAGMPETISALINLIPSSLDEESCWWAADRLRKSLQSDQFPEVVTQFPKVVATLKDCLTEQIHEKNSDLYNNCYEVVWHCAKNMHYPDFYQAWHSLVTPPKP
jgi:HEAT repeat protein